MAALCLVYVGMMLQAQCHAVALAEAEVSALSFCPSTLHRDDVVYAACRHCPSFLLAHLADRMLPDDLYSQLVPLSAVHQLLI